MKDTPEEITRKQFEIIYSKTPEQRLMMTIEMMDYAVFQTKKLIENWYPGKSELEKKLEFVRLYYRNDFSEDEMNNIIAGMRKSLA